MDYIEYVNNIDSLQILTLAKALCDYSFIMANRHNPTNVSFQKVFYDFYLRSRWAIMTPDNRKAYFGVMREYMNSNETISIEDVLIRLKVELGISSYEFSIASKMIHTINDDQPIFDAKIKKFFKDINNPLISDSQQAGNKLALISRDYECMDKWYQSFIASKNGDYWIDWFDGRFPEHKQISNVKKIDFIIWVSYK